MQKHCSIYRYLLLILIVTCPQTGSGQEHINLSISDTLVSDTSGISAWIRRGTLITWSNPDSSRILFRMALDKSVRAQDQRKTAESLLGMGNIYANTKDHETALKYYLNAVDLARQFLPPDSRFIQTLQNNIALSYTYLGLYKEAAEYYYAGIATTKIPEIKTALYINLSITQKALGDYAKAFHYIQEALTLALIHKEANYILPVIYANITDMQLSQGHVDAALQSGLQVLQMVADTSDLSLRHEINELLGQVYTMKNMPEKAVYHHRIGLEISHGYPMGQMRSSLSLGIIALNEKQYDTAEYYLTAALRNARELKMLQEMTNIYNYLADLYHATQRYKEAFAYQKQANILRDSSVSISKMRFVNLMDIKYQTAEKNKEIAEKKLLIARQYAYLIRKNMWIGGILATAILLIIAFWLFYRHKQRIQKHAEEITAWRAMAEGEEKERTRIARELHDGIGGALSTLNMYLATIQKRHPELAATTDYPEAMQLLGNTLTEVRNTAHNLMPELLLRHGLSEAVRIFCRNITAGGSLTIDYQYYGFINRFTGSLELAVYRIIQELVQNIRKHACADNALVQLSQHNHILSVTVEDNGIGMETNVPHAGLGLQSIQSRIKDLNGSFNVRSSKGKGTTVYFEINLQNV